MDSMTLRTALLHSQPVIGFSGHPEYSAHVQPSTPPTSLGPDPLLIDEWIMSWEHYSGQD